MTAMIKKSVVQWIGLVAGPLAGLTVCFCLPDSYAGQGGEPVSFSSAGRITAGTGVWMATWWMTEAIPIYVTAITARSAFSR